ncbi:hypothetical protein AB0H29_01890 [Streptomyces thermolilacinus]
MSSSLYVFTSRLLQRAKGQMIGDAAQWVMETLIAAQNSGAEPTALAPPSVDHNMTANAPMVEIEKKAALDKKGLGFNLESSIAERCSPWKTIG